MDTARTTPKLMMALFAAGAGLLLAASVRADSLSFTNTPAGSAVGEMSRRLGVSIVFRGKVNSSQPVTFSVDSPDTPEGRVQAMSELASALNMDFQKVYVISKIDPGTSVPKVKIDNDAPIVFPTNKVSAREAIQTIAGVDNALARISGSIKGNVVFPSLHMTASTAAAAVARQTGTVWHAYYGFFKAGAEPASLKGDVIDHDINGNPIMALPLVSFRNHVSKPAPTTELPLVGIGTVGPDGAPVTVVPNGGTEFAPGFGFSPYGYSGYSPYGYDYGNPYGYGGFGYPMPDGSMAYPGTVYSPGNGMEPVMPGVNAPGIFPPGSTITTVPNNNTTILPDYPFTGGGGPFMYGY